MPGLLPDANPRLDATTAPHIDGSLVKLGFTRSAAKINAGSRRVHRISWIYGIVIVMSRRDHLHGAFTPRRATPKSVEVMAILIPVASSMGREDVGARGEALPFHSVVVHILVVRRCS